MQIQGLVYTSTDETDMKQCTAQHSTSVNRYKTRYFLGDYKVSKCTFAGKILAGPYYMSSQLLYNAGKRSGYATLPVKHLGTEASFYVARERCTEWGLGCLIPTLI